MEQIYPDKIRFVKYYPGKIHAEPGKGRGGWRGQFGSLPTLGLDKLPN